MQLLNIATKSVLVLLASTIGSIGGAFVAYWLMTPLYLTYASFYPLNASGECSRGGGIAWLSIFAGALVGMIWSSCAVLRRYE